MLTLLRCVFVLFALNRCSLVCSNEYADQLYEDLLYYYNKNVRPVVNGTNELVTVKFAASLIRIIDLDEVNQVLTVNLWLEMGWSDVSLTWDPSDYGGITKMHLPADSIWLPDIVLYTNAMGNPQITILADALVYYDGTVCWKPPAIYNSFCQIDIEYFPYDEQHCLMKFGGWSYHGGFLDMQQVSAVPGHAVEKCPPSVLKNFKEDEWETCKGYLEMGMDLSGFQESAEWDLLSLTSTRHEQTYPGCCSLDMYVDMRFMLHLRRKPLFYTVNLVIPCMLIAILTTFVFYIPSSDHKITFAISILVTLIFFFLVLIDLIPPTSLVVPLIGRYLLFTIMLVFVGIIISVVTLNLFHRNGATHTMPDWVRWLFLQKLPSPLCIKPQDDQESGYSDDEEEDQTSDDVAFRFSEFNNGDNSSRRPSPYFMSVTQYANTQIRLSQLAELRGMHPDLIRRMIDNVSFIAEHYRALQAEDKVSEDWSYVAMVLDRLFLMIFTVVNICGTAVIVLQAPSLYDSRAPLSPPPAHKPLGGECVWN